MYVGVDDSGSFEHENYGMFVAAYIRPRKRERIEKLFLEWEAGLPSRCKVSNEVKGYLLSDSQICFFAKNILQGNSIFPIMHHVFATPTKGVNRKTIEKQRQVNVQQIIHEVEKFRLKGDDYKDIANDYSGMAVWLKKKSLKSLLKIELLGFTIVNSINDSILWSVNKKFDRELKDLTIKIDNSFIGKKDNMIYWRDLMRMIVWNLTYSVIPIIHLDRWTHHHPFIKRFSQYPKSRSKLAVFTKEIRKCMNFYDSKEHFEIRIADIIASTYFRHYVQGEHLQAIMDLRVTNLNRPLRPFSIVALYDSGKRAPNPYTDKVYGDSLADIKEGRK